MFSSLFSRLPRHTLSRFLHRVHPPPPPGGAMPRLVSRETRSRQTCSAPLQGGRLLCARVSPGARRAPPTPPHSKHEHVFHADQTASHPRKANQSGTRRIIEALPQGNVRIRTGMRPCMRRAGGFSPPHQRRAAAKVIKLELILHII